MNTKTGWPAFGHGAENGHCCGMTLLDYFAGQVIHRISWENREPEEMAKKSYAIAKAMLAEKERIENEKG